MRMTSHSRSTKRSSTRVASRLNLEKLCRARQKGFRYGTRKIDHSTLAQDREQLNAAKPTSFFHRRGLLQEDLSVLLHLFRKGLLVHVIHLDYINFIR